MRILYLVTSLGIGGAEKQVIAIAERMAARGHTVSLLTLKHAAEEWPVKLPVLRLNMSKTPSGLYRGVRFAGNFITLFRPDIVHSHTFPANIFARTLRLSGMKAIVLNTIHNVHEGGWHRMALYGLTNPLVDRVTAVSAAAAERFVRLHAVSRNKMSVVLNGIDSREFVPNKSIRKKTRSTMQAGDAFIWLAVGRIAPAKGYPNLLRAFTLVLAQHPDAQLWIAGEGDTSQFTYASQADPLSSFASSVQFLGLRRDIVSLLDAADGFVLSSAWEGMPLAVAEAMAMQKPVVATDVGGVLELIGEEGTVVPAKDSQALAEAMLHVMQMTVHERTLQGQRARERIELNFSIDAKALEWHRIYIRTTMPNLEQPEP